MDSGRQPAHRALAPAGVRHHGGRPISLRYGDVYHDADGVAEVHRVFLEPAKIRARMARRSDVFTICELGFGAALNFAVTAQTFIQHSPNSARLHFISVEASPLSAADFATATARWRSSLPVFEPLRAAYPPLINGWHRRYFYHGRIQLSVFFGDVGDALDELCGRQHVPVDAFFLDGFAPARNPEMWRLGLFEQLAKLASNGATATTFSAAGVVKRNLAAAGFRVQRIDQRPHKRHSVLATLPFTPPPKPLPAPSRVTVIGAGIAGATVASALAARGFGVDVLERADRIAAGASAIPAAVQHGRLLTDGSVNAALRAHAYAFSTTLTASRSVAPGGGAIQLPGPNTSMDKLVDLAATLPDDWAAMIDSELATELSGIPIATPACHFPHSRMLDGGALCHALLASDRIQMRFALAGIELDPEAPTVLACGQAVGAFERCRQFELAPLAGQVDVFEAVRAPRLPIVADGYCAPARDENTLEGRIACHVGSTYEYQPWQVEQATDANAKRYAGLFGSAPGRRLRYFRGIRSVTSDRIPIIGRVDATSNTYVSTGHGSAGMCYAPLAGEWIASLIAGEVPPVTRAIEALCQPGRFADRQLRRPNPFKSRKHERS